MMTRPVLRWKLNDILTDEQVSVYALNQRLVEAGRGVSRTTLYRLASKQPERIDLEVAGRVLWGLEQLTGKHYTVTDLLEYDAADSGIADVEAQMRAWHDADLSRLGEIEPYDWGDTDPETVGEPLRLDQRRTGTSRTSSEADR